MNNYAPDAGIPVLTEVIDVASDDSLPASASDSKPDLPAVASSPESPNEVVEIKTLLSGSDEDWSRLERKIRERILRQLLARVDSALEQRVRDSLADVLQTAVEGLANEIRSGLHEGLEDLVTRAVSQEITRLKTPPK